ncbi:hypothetical protein [Desulfitobacterium sp.]|uniref:hypothetical protein n=1 Tax=Desulfitobacterium sp. TaxID=49981 RepID=UPI002B1F515C|nr:hypothetical protein [Desulfitobacterium sp.]MEA4902560.1 hypothetical protein [Desulfitobacterium sp.]
MNKKILLVIMAVSLFLIGCGNSVQTSESPVLEPKESAVVAEASTGSNDTVMSIPSGTFEFAPDNLKNIEGFAPIENKTAI